MEEAKNQNIQRISDTIHTILDYLGVVYAIESQEGSEGVWFVIKTDDSALLIGEGGKNLAALNHVVRRIAERQITDIPHFLIDINDYHKKRIEEIKDMARLHAQRVRYFKKDIELRPMTAYERRIVHSALQEYPDIKTESVGEGRERRVVIKPFSMVS